MNVDQARKILESNRVPKQWYSFDRVMEDEVSILVRDGGYWVAYGISRGSVVGRRRFESESDACLDFVESLVYAEEANRLGARPLRQRIHKSITPDGYDREYASEWIQQFGIDQSKFDLAGVITNGKYVVQRDPESWVVWLEDHGKQRHKAWIERPWGVTMYILAMLRPRPWKGAGEC